MHRQRWQHVQELFAQAVELDASRREAFLDEACGDDPELRREVDSLLDADAATDSLVDAPLFDLHAASPAPARIGPYEILEELGHGGLGTVYLAARVEFEQRVALKVIKRGMDTDEVVRRFHRERQILANLEHPHIARLLDGGSTGDGQPYFVMELVDGERLDRYCETHTLPVEARLRLFLQVCSAVQHAHRNLVVHRDLKPSNVLVTVEGPKLLDFGIAKLLAPGDGTRTSLTELGSTPMTPDYASPEQVRGDAMTTATDVYSLGVILHELVTGRLPSAADGDTRHRLSGDLGSIVGKALREEPEHRYGSVDQLADDVRRHLDGLPVLAREGALLYRAGKFARRNRWRLATAAALLLVTAFGVATRRESARQVAQAELAEQLAAERANEAYRQAQIRSELLRNIFAAPDLRDDERFTVRELLERGEHRVRANLEDEPLATQLEILGRLYGDLGDRAEASRLLEETLGVRREIYEGDHPLLARVLNNLAARHYLDGEYDQAEALYREALDMRRRLGQDDVDVVTSLSNLASIYMYRGEYAPAEELYRRALAIRRQAYGDDDSAVAKSLRSLGTLLYLRGDAAGAEPLLRRALEIRLDLYGEHDTRVAAARSSLGRALHELGRYEEAERLLTAVLASRRELLGEDHPHVALTKKDLAALWLDRDRPADAEALLAPALEVLRRWKPEGWEVADAESLWGACVMARGRFEEARPYLDGSYARLRELRGEDAVYTRRAYRRVVDLYDAWGRELP